MIKYISDGTWFDEGEECIAIWIDNDIGLFKGYRTCINPNAEAHPKGERYLDEEMCGVDEFEVIQ